MVKKRGAGIHPIELIYPRPLRFLSRKLHTLVKGKLWLKVLIGMFLGIILGFILGPTFGIVDAKLASLIAEWVALPGIIFLRVIQMIVIPLIIASIIKGIAASESMKQLKKTGLLVAIYFIFTTTIAIVIGLLLAFWIQPGNYINKEVIQSSLESEIIDNQKTEISTPTLQELPSLIGTILPTNFFGSLVNGEMLQIVIFSLIFGIALINIKPENSKTLFNLLGSLQDVSMTIVKWIMLIAPIAVFGLMVKLTSQFGIETLYGVGVYVLTVLLGLLVLLIFYTIIVFLSSGLTPLIFLKKIRDVQLLAFSTSSSAAVMPLSMKISEENLKVQPSISQFIIPMGATINMDGTALYQGIATIFLAQVFGINLGLTALLLLIVTVVGASIGAPGTPGIGIAILAVVLSSVGIPVIGLLLILSVDRILDMSRTAINVTGDLTASIFVNKIVSSEKTHTELLIEEHKREKQRKTLDQDVIIKKTPTK